MLTEGCVVSMESRCAIVEKVEVKARDPVITMTRWWSGAAQWRSCLCVPLFSRSLKGWKNLLVIKDLFVDWWARPWGILKCISTWLTIGHERFSFAVRRKQKVPDRSNYHWSVYRFRAHACESPRKSGVETTASSARSPRVFPATLNRTRSLPSVLPVIPKAERLPDAAKGCGSPKAALFHRRRRQALASSGARGKKGLHPRKLPPIRDARRPRSERRGGLKEAQEGRSSGDDLTPRATWVIWRAMVRWRFPFLALSNWDPR